MKNEIERAERMKLGRETKRWSDLDFIFTGLDDEWVTPKLVINGNKTCSMQEIINY